LFEEDAACYILPNKLGKGYELEERVQEKVEGGKIKLEKR